MKSLVLKLQEKAKIQHSSLMQKITTFFSQPHQRVQLLQGWGPGTDSGAAKGPEQSSSTVGPLPHKGRLPMGHHCQTPSGAAAGPESTCSLYTLLMDPQHDPNPVGYWYFKCLKGFENE